MSAAKSRGRGATARRGLLKGVLLLQAVAVATACSSEGDLDVGPYTPELRAALDQSSNDFERGVFEDLQIERAEYEESVDRFMQCTQNRGLDVGKDSDPAGYYTFNYANTVNRDGQPSKQDLAVDECRIGTINLIEPLYVEMLVNPEKVDPLIAVAECLVNAGKVPDNYNAQRLMRDLQAQSLPFDDEKDEVAAACFDA